MIWNDVEVGGLMASGLALEDRGGDEEGRNVLQTLASIKSQISSVLGLLQTAHVSAEGAVIVCPLLIITNFLLFPKLIKVSQLLFL